ncbi:AAA family ATPase, partial [Acinetobacter pittii]
MQIILPKNNLHSKTQEVHFEKVTALIGENGAGKSSILQSIFYGWANSNMRCDSLKSLMIINKL